MARDKPDPMDGWRERFARASQLIGASTEGDTLGQADALWLARVLPPPDRPQGEASSSERRRANGARKAESIRRSGKRLNIAKRLGTLSGGEGAQPSDKSSSADAETGSLFAAQPMTAGEDELKVRRVRVPSADALPQRSAIERALRPFLRRLPSRTHTAIDADATAEVSARASAESLGAVQDMATVLVPVVRPVAQRWFDVALLAEDDEAMQVFDETLLELRKLLARHGAFAQVRLWHWSVQGNEVVVTSASGSRGGQRAVLQSQRPQLVLLCTHGASGHWNDEPLRRFVRELGERAVLAVVQMLPQSSWSFTPLGEATERVRSPERGALNQQLQRMDFWSGRFLNHPGADAAPMMSLDASSIANWAKWVMAPRLLEHPAVALTPPELDADIALVDTAFEREARPAAQADLQPDPPGEQVMRFRTIASKQAYALLRLLAAAWVTVPVMRLLLNSLPGPRATAPLAEVLLSGLLLRQSPKDTPAHELVFEFAPGVRDWILGSLSSVEQRQATVALADSRESIRRFVENKTGRQISSFEALLEDSQGTELLPASARSFVEVSRRLRAFQSTPAVTRSIAPNTRAPLPEPAAAGANAGVANHAPAGPSAPVVARVFNLPPEVIGLVERQPLKKRLRRRILALGSGEQMLLRARHGAGATTLLADLMRDPDIQALFSGGIWFDADPPEKASEPHEGRRLTIDFGRKVRRGESQIWLVWDDAGPVDIDYLTPEEAARHLKSMDVKPADIERLQAVHSGVPAFVPLVGVGSLMGVSSWPRQVFDPSKAASKNDWDAAFDRLAKRVWRAIPAAQRHHLVAMSARRYGYPGVDVDEESLAWQLAWQLALKLGWQFSGRRKYDGPFKPSVRAWLATNYAGEVSLAHARICSALHEHQHSRAWIDYRRRHLIEHVGGTAGSRAVAALLFDREMLKLLLADGVASLVVQLGPWIAGDSRLAEMSKLLEFASSGVSMLENARKPLSPPLPWTLRAMNINKAWAMGVVGRGVRIAVLAMGVDPKHPELQHLEISGDLSDPDGHGTAMASVIAGAFFGIAPAARLHSASLRDLSGSPTGQSFVEICEEWLALPAGDRPHIVCLSFGTLRMDRTMERGVAGLLNAGILVIAPAGNNGGARPEFPAAMRGVLSVGAMSHGNEMAEFSSRGCDVWAPGADITAAQALPMGNPSVGSLVALDPAGYEGLKLYDIRSGTSYACAAVAGLAALYAQASGLRGSALRELLLRTARDHKIGPRAVFDPAAVSSAEDPSGGARTRARWPTAAQLRGQELWSELANVVSASKRGRDVISVAFEDGPELFLHPSSAAALLATHERVNQLAHSNKSFPVQSVRLLQIRSIEVLNAPKVRAMNGLNLNQAVDALEGTGPQLYPLDAGSRRRLLVGGDGLSAALGSIGDFLPSQPLLILLHDTLSDTQISFGALWQEKSGLGERLASHFAGRIYGYDHPTLQVDVISNALALAYALPQGARLMLGGLGRGGLIAEVLALASERNPKIGKALKAEFSDRFSKQRHKQLGQLFDVLNSKNIRVERVVRVASPIRGDTLCDGHVDAYLSFFQWALGANDRRLAGARNLISMTVARDGVGPRAFPGLADLLPDSALIQWLNEEREPINAELAVLSGAIRGDNSLGAYRSLFAQDQMDATENDMIVETRSMFGGVPRRRPSRFLRSTDPNLTHFGFFQHMPTALAFVEALMGVEVGFEEIGPMAFAGLDGDGTR